MKIPGTDAWQTEVNTPYQKNWRAQGIDTGAGYKLNHLNVKALNQTIPDILPQASQTVFNVSPTNIAYVTTIAFFRKVRKGFLHVCQRVTPIGQQLPHKTWVHHTFVWNARHSAVIWVRAVTETGACPGFLEFGP